MYDLPAQKQLQARILGSRAKDFQPYLNPPLLAILLTPLVTLGYVHAFYMFDAVCVLALAAGLLALGRLTPAISATSAGRWTLVLVVAGWQPMLQTTLGGQNTPITFALLAALGLALQANRFFLSALALGALTYKPQYAVGIGIALLLAGRFRLVAAGALLGVLHWMAGAWWCGAKWPLDMLEFMRAYRPMELAENAATHFSWVRTADFLLPSPLDTIAAAGGVALVLGLWWRFRGLAERNNAVWFALAITGTMLASPHQQYYDAALLVLPIALLLDDDLCSGHAPSLAVRVALAAAYVGYPAWELAATLHFQPLFVLLLAVFLWSLRNARRPGRTETTLVATPSSGPAPAGNVLSV